MKNYFAFRLILLFVMILLISALYITSVRFGYLTCVDKAGSNQKEICACDVKWLDKDNNCGVE